MNKTNQPEQFKLEIIDNTINNRYEYNVYVLKKKNWYSLSKEYCFVEGHRLGKNYMCPSILQGKETVKSMFKNDLRSVKNRYTFSEIHKVKISK